MEFGIVLWVETKKLVNTSGTYQNANGVFLRPRCDINL